VTVLTEKDGELTLKPDVKPRPFLKWAGGKSQLLPELVARLPKNFKAYHEPFVGSGALFFDLFQRQQLSEVYLSDINRHLIAAYLALQKQVEAVIDLLKRHQRLNSRNYYYRIRRRTPSRSTERTARLIYLNKTCFNGLYRENKSGQFNVPYGSYENPTICDEDNLRSVARALRSVVVKCHSYEKAMSQARQGDFVYLDPPYYPLSGTSSFTAYDREGFTVVDQCRLRIAFEDLHTRGAYVMMSNSDTPLINELYRRFRIDKVFASRLINSRSDKRGKITELIIRNYK